MSEENAREHRNEDPEKLRKKKSPEEDEKWKDSWSR